MTEDLRSSNMQLANMQLGGCAHLHISWLTQEMQQGVRGWWACRDCGMVFVPMKVYEAEIERLNAELREWTEIGHDATTQQSVVLMSEIERLRAALVRLREFPTSDESRGLNDIATWRRMVAIARNSLGEQPVETFDCSCGNGSIPGPAHHPTCTAYRALPHP